MSVQMNLEIVQHPDRKFRREIRVSRITKPEYEVGRSSAMDEKALNEVHTYTAQVINGYGREAGLAGTFQHRFGDDQYVLAFKAMEALGFMEQVKKDIIDDFQVEYGD